MFVAVSLASILYRFLYPSADIAVLDMELVQCYQVFALCIAPLFLTVLAANGVYSRTRLSEPFQQRLRLLFRALAISIVVCLAANYMLFRAHIVARGLLICFATVTIVGFAASRWVEDKLRPHFELVRTTGRSRRPDDAPILVIGGAGYIGSMLCRKLLADGERVRVLDSLVYGDFAIKELFGHPRFEFIHGDCRHIQSVVGAVTGVKAIAQLAAIVGDPACEQDKLSALEINYAATRMLIEVAKGHNIERVVFASSCSVYGATDELMDELSPVLPISLYGQTKIESERVLLAARSEDFHPVILRLATVFGHGYRPRFDLLVNLLSARAAQEGIITVYNEQQWRPFIHVWDVARGFAAALTAPREKVSGEIFNLGDNSMNFTLAGVADEVGRAFPGTEVKRILNEDRRTYRVDFTKIRDVLGYRCTISLREGIAELRKSLEDGTVTDYNDLRYNNQKFLAASGQLPVAHEMDHAVMAAFANNELFQISQDRAA
jgi:nucleoside-diphosphate-sugar epimerase